jgi:glycosyltransferase involved in cell wall biosynthesis
VRIAMIGYTFYELDARVKRAADALVESGHHVELFVADHAGLRAPNSALLTIHRLRMRKQRSAVIRYAYEYGFFCAWAFVLISFFHVRRRYDVVYAHNMPNFLVFAGCLPKIGGAKIVLDVHDPAPELLSSIRGRDLPGWMRSLATAEERVSMSFSDALITVNESMRRRVSAMSGRPVTVVMNLPDPAVFGAREEPRRREGQDFLVYSGAIAHRNGPDLIIEALSLLDDEFPDLRLRIIGNGSALESLVRMAGDLGVADRVDFLDWVPNHEIPGLVSGAAAGVSAHREDTFGSLVFSMKVAEYAALGLPVACSGITTMRHYFDDDELMFFEPGNARDLARAIRDLLTDPGAAEERAARTRIKLGKLDWPAQKETLVGTVEALASGKRLRSRGESAMVKTP